MLNKNIAFLGIMSGLAAMLQVSAGIIPVVGHLLSAFSTLAITFSGRLGWKQGILSYFSSTMIILLIQPAEAPIFLFTIGY